jgi:arylsulfatase B
VIFQGSFDASFRGSNQFITPNLDALAYNGIIFDRFYTPSMCTPSRASMMTGKYPFKIGMQNWVVQANEGWKFDLI